MGIKMGLEILSENVSINQPTSCIKTAIRDNPKPSSQTSSNLDGNSQELTFLCIPITIHNIPKTSQQTQSGPENVNHLKGSRWAYYGGGWNIKETDFLSLVSLWASDTPKFWRGILSLACVSYNSKSNMETWANT